MLWVLIRIAPAHKNIRCGCRGDPNEYSQHTFLWRIDKNYPSVGPRQANLVLIAYASSEGSGEPAHPRSYKQ